MLGDASFLSYAGPVPAWNACFTKPHWMRQAQTPQDVPAVIEAADRRARNGEWIVLALAYEAAAAFDPGLAVHALSRTPLLFAAAYAAPVAAPVPAEATAGAPFSTTDWRPTISREHYGRALAEIRENIRIGEVYQVNHTISLASRFSGDPAAWFAALAPEQAARYCCRLDLGRWHILSFSPELFFSRQGETVTVRPMKGTMPRGRTPTEDQAAAAALAACPKNRAENRMITDLVRNDLGRIAKPGSVSVPELFAVERLGTAWQMTSTVSARVPRGTGLLPLFTALFPCGSITGAPKRSAMGLIRRLESGPRGFYTGALGHIAPGGDCTFSVAIRTVILDGQTGEGRFGVGGGITHYSDVTAEYEECRVKAAFLSLPAEPFELLETLRLDGGRFSLLDGHLSRLARSADYFGFSCSTAAVLEALETVRQSHPLARRRVRLLVSRDGSVQAQSYPLGSSDGKPLRLGLCARPVDAASPALFHKTTRRSLYDRALAEHPGCDDVLLTNARGQVTESCRANLVAEIAGRLVTPALSCGLLPGTFRARLLARGILAEAELTPEDLTRARRLWLINSVRFWQPARLIVADAAGD